MANNDRKQVPKSIAPRWRCSTKKYQEPLFFYCTYFFLCFYVLKVLINS